MTARTQAPSARFPKRLLYGRRRGRPLRAHRRELLGQLLPRLALPPEGPLDPRALFGAQVKDWALEIGAGSGEHAVSQIRQNPQTGLIACEPYLNGVAALLAKLEGANAGNIRIHPGDARDVVERLVAHSLSRVFILFPDPWPKKRHWKRRLVSDENLASLARVMAKGAELRFATDSMDYCAFALAAFARQPAFAWRAQGPSDWRQRPADWPETRYEAKAKAAGRACVYLSFVRL